MKRKPPEYIEKLAGLEFKPGVYHVTIFHDDWCDLLAGTGPCNCDPDTGEIDAEPPE